MWDELFPIWADFTLFELDMKHDKSATTFMNECTHSRQLMNKNEALISGLSYS